MYLERKFARNLLGTCVSAELLKNLKLRKTKFSPEFFRKFPNIVEGIQTHPEASKHIRTGPGRSQQVPKPQKTCQSLPTLQKFRKQKMKNKFAKELVSSLAKGGVRDRWGWHSHFWHKLWLHFFWPTFWLHCILYFTYRGGFAPSIGRHYRYGTKYNVAIKLATSNGAIIYAKAG